MLKVAIVGCGLMADEKHLPAFLRLGDRIEVVALCDLNEGVAKELAAKFKVRRTYSDFLRMLSEEKPDIVDICTPPQTHARLALEALENNCHVLLEKPMALNVMDCDTMLRAASEHGRKICVVHNQIFNPVVIRARQIISRKELGDFLGMRIFLSTPVWYMTSRSDHWAHGLPGGVLGETGPHAIYMSLEFLDNVREVNIYAKKHCLDYPWSNFEDFTIDLIADNGTSSITLMYGSDQWAGEVDIFASSGILKLDLEGKSLLRYNRRGLEAFAVAKSTLSISFQLLKETIRNGIDYVLGKDRDAHYVLIQKFIESILNNTPSPVSGESAREVVRVMELITKRLKER